jgi:hypothetical protein
MIEDDCAGGADDAALFRQKFRKRRFQMIADTLGPFVGKERALF